MPREQKNLCERSIDTTIVVRGNKFTLRKLLSSVYKSFVLLKETVGSSEFNNKNSFRSFMDHYILWLFF